MVKAFLISLMALLTLTAAPLVYAENAGMTEAEVRTFWSQGNTLAKARKMNELMKLFAPDARIEISANGETKKLSLSEYAKMTNQGMELVEHYDFNSKINSIKINGNRATLNATTMEKIDLGEHGKFSSVTQEVNQIEKRAGKLYVVDLKANMSVSPDTK